MTNRTVRLSAHGVAADEIRAAIDVLVAATEVPVEFPPAVLEAAERAAGSWQNGEVEREDLRDIPFVTLDPASSTDLDQALHIDPDGDGFRVRYAIADVPAFVHLGDVIDQEARRRGATVYLPGRRVPLHPEVLSEGAASLLPDQDAPAFVWDMRLDAAGAVTACSLTRAVVRSREKLAYDAVQHDLDAGQGHPMMLLLQQVGDLRIEQEKLREGASLNTPEQEVEENEDGSVRLAWRTPQPIEDSNAQISLMTGMAAAQMMIDAGVGILRTMPAPTDEARTRFRLQAEALGITWADGQPYGQFLRTLDWRNPQHLALLNHAGVLFRGAGYLPLGAPPADDDADEAPSLEQAAIGAPYAHVTAPLRRLVDRFGLLVCWMISTDRAIPAELRAALGELPEIMKSTGSVAGKLEREAVDLVEVLSLKPFVGQEFTGTVIKRSDGEKPRVEVQLVEPPVTTWVAADADLGTHVRLRLERIAEPEKDGAIPTAEFSLLT
ncbi:RNB domain-containing ribonuclease [Helcobacillus massiliensis]|uniref:Exoribonuclease R n=1 Tax=Helcobacillus massiliensis TaxID=521392 RepID=A0A839QQX6_9MICO|nr:RNB domain-containing ribonuclease [Helcobacillus massiliensis]MBB3022412.1 exoribonuclease R [Helcobacillus massiliensis]MCT1557048.1 RNB domain-containing ribonuclease [Helcobacillus massiliensis]MCT2035437.1 RNB domain-containing ribonuclease [Helcobacillus massiliensis]MCT2331348.1 RNB domain-containing ribonuclease [Helcobacillus massiliensis]